MEELRVYKYPDVEADLFVRKYGAGAGESAAPNGHWDPLPNWYCQDGVSPVIRPYQYSRSVTRSLCLWASGLLSISLWNLGMLRYLCMVKGIDSETCLDSRIGSNWAAFTFWVRVIRSLITP